jgi:hypothetical protein
MPYPFPLCPLHLPSGAHTRAALANTVHMLTAIGREKAERLIPAPLFPHADICDCIVFMVYAHVPEQASAPSERYLSHSERTKTSDGKRLVSCRQGNRGLIGNPNRRSYRMSELPAFSISQDTLSTGTNAASMIYLSNTVTSEKNRKTNVCVSQTPCGGRGRREAGEQPEPVSPSERERTRNRCP